MVVLRVKKKNVNLTESDTITFIKLSTTGESGLKNKQNPEKGALTLKSCGY